MHARMSRRGNCRERDLVRQRLKNNGRVRRTQRFAAVEACADQAAGLTHVGARQDVFDRCHPNRNHTDTDTDTDTGMLSSVDYEIKQQRMQKAGISETRGTSGMT
jgi:hypothetical protein